MATKRKSKSSPTSRSRSRSKTTKAITNNGSQRKGMSTAAKVAIAAGAGAVAITAAGLATTDRGRKVRQRVTKKIQELVDKGSITLKNSKMRHVVEEIESAIGGLLSRGKHGRGELTPSSSSSSGDRAETTRPRGNRRGGRS